MNPLRRNPYGFTLLELLIAISILTIVVTLFYGTYFMVARTVRSSETRANAFHRASILLNKMAFEITSAYTGLYSSESEELNMHLIGDDGQIDDHDADSLRFLSSGSPMTRGVPENQIFSHISYSVESVDESDEVTLVCSRTPFLAAAENGAFNEWKLSISEFNLQYYDGSGWLSEWDTAEQKALPEAVRIEVTLPDDEGQQWMFSTVADIPLDTVIEETAKPQLE